ncbi:restriction endonuclease subunit S [Stappia sp. F7233]|uniref:Restriction endonuclease subunit S n=1 Tax=Stappia albiluteola TaxID=2758565 RepID=A0A839ADN4_9HYPH|nr:restriction endonuclease subunit S [Stappia albiluteola]MBA5777022.1 restriction endonuclease subunit S [Stappia albiluteola]
MISSEQAIERRQPTAPDQSVAEPGRYPAYKAARVHWLGEIPAHWSEKRGKYFFREIDERSQTGEEELLSVSHTTGVTPRSQKNVTMFKAESYVGHKVARPNDVVINTMWAWMSALGVSKNVGIVSPAYGVYRPLNSDDFLPEYVDYLLRTPMLRWEYICRSTGIRASRLRLYPDKFLDIAFPCPPIAEQERMVGFLRAKEAQVRRLIRNKRRLIGLLNEQKQAIINRAVTRGLNPDAPMKPTGIDWMPEVPAHWDVLKLKRFSRMKSGDSITAESIDETGTYPVYGGNGLRGYTDRFTHKGTFALVGRQGALCGNVHRISGIFWASEHAIVTTLEPPNDIEWFVELLRVMNLNQYSESAAQPGLAVDDIANLYAPRPPAEEQAEIARYFRAEFSNLNAVLERTGNEIALIREYRERLIADVVTGKLDLRHVEIAALADEPIADEDDTLEDELDGDDVEVMEGADADD